MRNLPSDFLPLVHTLLPQKHHGVCKHRAFAPLGPIWPRSASQTQQRGQGAPGATWLSAAAPHAARNGRSTAATPVPDPGCAALLLIPSFPLLLAPLVPSARRKPNAFAWVPASPAAGVQKGNPCRCGAAGTGKSDKSRKRKALSSPGCRSSSCPAHSLRGPRYERRRSRCGAPRGSAPLRAARRPGPLRAGHGAPQPHREPPAPAARSAQRRQERGAERGAEAGGLRREGGERRLRPERGAERGCARYLRACSPRTARGRQPRGCTSAPRLCAWMPVRLRADLLPWFRTCLGSGRTNSGPRGCASARRGCRTAPEVCVSSRGCAATPRGCRLDPRFVHSGYSSTVARLFPGCDGKCGHLFPLHPHPRALSIPRLFRFSPGRFELQVPQRKAALRPRRGASGGLQGFGSTVLLCKAINRRAEGRETGHCWERSPVRRCQAVPCTTPPTMQAQHCTVQTVSSPQLCSAQRPKWGHRGTLGKSCWKSPCTAPWSISW